MGEKFRFPEIERPNEFVKHCSRSIGMPEGSVLFVRSRVKPALFRRLIRWLLRRPGPRVVVYEFHFLVAAERTAG